MIIFHLPILTGLPTNQLDFKLFVYEHKRPSRNKLPRQPFIGYIYIGLIEYYNDVSYTPKQLRLVA